MLWCVARTNFRNDCHLRGDWWVDHNCGVCWGLKMCLGFTRCCIRSYGGSQIGLQWGGVWLQTTRPIFRDFICLNFGCVWHHIVVVDASALATALWQLPMPFQSKTIAHMHLKLPYHFLVPSSSKMESSTWGWIPGWFWILGRKSWVNRISNCHEAVVSFFFSFFFFQNSQNFNISLILYNNFAMFWSMNCLTGGSVWEQLGVKLGGLILWVVQRYCLNAFITSMTNKMFAHLQNAVNVYWTEYLLH